MYQSSESIAPMFYDKWSHTLTATLFKNEFPYVSTSTPGMAWTKRYLGP
jgi:hypothetical protein